MSRPSGSVGPPEGKVRTTLNLDAKLVEAAKIAAIRLSTERGKKITLGELVEEGLRLLLARKGGGDKPPKR